MYEQNRCWGGWSLFHPTKLVRESSKHLPNGTPLTIRELLKSKVHEGVRVIVLLWDDKTSHDKFLLKMVGFTLIYICISLSLCLSRSLSTPSPSLSVNVLHKNV
jgi:hypothetical protein